MSDPSPSPYRPPRDRRRTRDARRRARVRFALRALGVLLVFAAGLALGDALGDRPREPRELTGVRDVRQVEVTRTVGVRTITVVVTTP